MTNGTTLLPGVDGRSRQARRYRDLLAAYTVELGGEAQTEATRTLLRQAAGLAVQSEELQAAIVLGEPVDYDQLVRVSNLLARSLRQLGIGKAPAQPRRTLRDHLAGRRA